MTWLKAFGWFLGCTLFAALAGMSCNSKTPTADGYLIGSVFATLGLFCAWRGWIGRKHAKGPEPLWSWGVWYLVSFVLVWIAYPIFQSAKIAADQARCISAVKESALAVLQYASDYDDRFPARERWRSATKDRGSMKEDCPQRKSEFGLGMNSYLSGATFTGLEAPAMTCLIFELESNSPDGSGSRQNVVWRHGSRTPIGRADGSAKFFSKGDFDDVLWQP